MIYSDVRGKLLFLFRGSDMIFPSPVCNLSFRQNTPDSVRIKRTIKIGKSINLDLKRNKLLPLFSVGEMLLLQIFDRFVPKYGVPS